MDAILVRTPHLAIGGIPCVGINVAFRAEFRRLTICSDSNVNHFPNTGKTAKVALSNPFPSPKTVRYRFPPNKVP